MFSKSTGVMVAVAALVGLLLGLALWGSPVVGQGFLGQRVLNNSGNGAVSQTLSVSGSGEVRVKPDVAFVTVGVETQAEKANQAQQENADRMAAVVEAIKNLGVPEADLQTSAIILQPIRDFERRPDGGRGEIVGYRAINQVSVRVTDLSLVGPVLDEAVKAGANTQGNIRFTIQDDADLQRQALETAVHDARGKADAMARALGVTIKGVHTATEGSVSIPMRMEEARSPVADGMDSATPIEPGEMIVRAQVHVVYNY